MKKISRIISYGCSFTSGLELSDSFFWKESENIEVVKSKYDGDSSKFYKKYDYLLDTSATQMCANMSWAGQIAKLLDLPLVNRAVPGFSNQAILYALNLDIANNNILPSDIVLVGLTSINRWFYLRNDRKIALPMIRSSKNWPDENFHKVFIEHIANPYYMHYSYFNTIQTIDLLSKKFENRILQQFIPCSYEYYLNQDKEISNDLKFINMLNTMKGFDSIIDFDLSLDSYVSWQIGQDLHGFSHPKVEFHEKLANSLFKCEKLKNVII